MKLRLILLYVFNIIDTITTLYLTQIIGLEEANPVCRFLLSVGPVLFVVVKLAVVTFCCWDLWRLRDEKLAQIATWIPFTAYGLLVAYHGFIFYILFRLNLI
ncbi:MAG: hypothetical protein IJX94_01360 [Clostridia bacterium]|nr:hypothetical protein [Clostridia bacterium]